MSPRKLETNTAAPLSAPPPLSKDDAVQQVLGKLFDLLMKADNVSAAKVWLDTVLKHNNDESEGLKPEEALALMAQGLERSTP